MVFNNETINKLREKKRTFPSQGGETDSISTMSTTISITEAIINADIESSESLNHWFFGIQEKIYPYHLLTAIVECLKAMNFVYIIKILEMEI